MLGNHGQYLAIDSRDKQLTEARIEISEGEPGAGEGKRMEWNAIGDRATALGSSASQTQSHTPGLTVPDILRESRF